MKILVDIAFLDIFSVLRLSSQFLSALLSCHISDVSQVERISASSLGVEKIGRN